MNSKLSTLLPENENKLVLISIFTTALIAGLLTLFGIYVVEDYGIALFIFIPFYIGFGSTTIYGLKKEMNNRKALKIGFLTLLTYSVGLIVFAIEGLICIIMAFPFAALFTIFGSSVANYFVQKNRNSPTKLFIILLSIPTTSYLESHYKPEIVSVTTHIEINATPSEVWKHVIEFPALEKPTEFIFKTGIAYPIDATIQGEGVGAVRYCNFTTGSFVEPITVWNEPHLLQFDVLEQPAPMKEMSFWDIDAPHLHDYFVSQKGQFKLSELPNGNTLLEGTTWYYHNIKPVFYWGIWSEHIIHKIHERVLVHIKKNAERREKM